MLLHHLPIIPFQSGTPEAPLIFFLFFSLTESSLR